MRTLSQDRLNKFIEASKTHFSWDVVLSSNKIKVEKTTITGYALKCPFHDDWNPSFLINFDLGVYHCFSCGRKGTITRLMYELSGTASGYAEYCETLLKQDSILIAKTGFESLYIDTRKLDASLQKRRTFSASTALGRGMTHQMLADKVRRNIDKSVDDAEWKSLVYTLSLLQSGMSPEGVYKNFTETGLYFDKDFASMAVNADVGSGDIPEFVGRISLKGLVGDD